MSATTCGSCDNGVIYIGGDRLAPCPTCNASPNGHSQTAIQPEPEALLVPSMLSGSRTTRTREETTTLVVSEAIQPEPSSTSGCINPPKDATADMRAVAADFAKALSEHRTRHDDLPMPYSTGYCAKRCGWTTKGQPDKGRASRAINALVRAGVIKYAGTLPPRGKPNGTKTYAEPNRGAA